MVRQRHFSSRFEPADHLDQLRPLLAALAELAELAPPGVDRLLRRHPKEGRGAFSKAELIAGLRYLEERGRGHPGLLARLRMKPVRTLSGVAPVTVLTRPHPCPGECIFCPNDVRMPKSYISSEPGAQRAAQHAFDPYAQTAGRLRALHRIGHRVDKVELIVLGGTWSSYPESYQRWFLKRCFDALNDFEPAAGSRDRRPAGMGPEAAARPFGELPERGAAGRYNRVVSDFLAAAPAPRPEAATWDDLLAAQRVNESAAARCVGLALETRPDHIDAAEALRLRRLGATRIQVGLQSLSDEVLAANRRGHDVAAARRAMSLLRAAGFKLHAHWMANLYGSDPTADRVDFRRLFADPAIRPDELKLYPCSLIDDTALMELHRQGRWRPYEHGELLALLADCLAAVPPYCRVSRVIRDIPSQEIMAGNRLTNFRQLADDELARRGVASRDIRAREVRGREVDPRELRLVTLEYGAGGDGAGGCDRGAGGREQFLQLVTRDGALAGFLRLALPAAGGPAAPEELQGSAVIREIHVYGRLAGLGESSRGRAQHAGGGERLIEIAARRARAAGYRGLAVISAVGTRGYYRRRGFADGELYQHRAL